MCPLCSFVIFAVLSFLCRYCSSLHKTEPRQHTRVSTLFNSEAVLRPENPSDRNFFHPQVRLYDSCTHTNVSCSKILAHNAENEHFPPPILRSFLSAAARDNVIRHGLGRGLGPRSNFALPTVVQSINVHHLPHPLSELSPCSIVPINQWYYEVTRRR